VHVPVPSRFDTTAELVNATGLAEVVPGPSSGQVGCREGSQGRDPPPITQVRSLGWPGQAFGLRHPLSSFLHLLRNWLLALGWYDQELFI